MNLLRQWRNPSTLDVTIDPELSALAVLEASLTVTVHALEAANPELDPASDTWLRPPPVALAAREIVVHVHHVLDLIERYRRLLEDAAQRFGPDEEDLF